MKTWMWFSLCIVHAAAFFGVASAQESSLFHHPYPPSVRIGPTPPRVMTQPSTESNVSDLASPAVTGLGPVQAASPYLNSPGAFPPSTYPSGASPPGAYLPYSSYGQHDPALGLTSASWTYQPAPPLRTFRKHDIITIRVDELGRMLAQGDAQKRRSSTFTATLTDWLQLSDGQLGPAAQEDGDPTVGTASNDRFRNQATVETREALTFSIASTIVDILPNGNLVLEARKSIRANDNVWETSLTGVCRPIDVGPDNVVLSKVMMNLEIHKEDQGQLRDGYKRGWLSRWIDRLNPF